MTAHVNEEGIVLRFSTADNFPTQQWEILLDQLKSVHLPSFYRAEKRMLVVTADTVTLDQAIDILHHWNIEVHDVRIEP